MYYKDTYFYIEQFVFLFGASKLKIYWSDFENFFPHENVTLCLSNMPESTQERVERRSVQPFIKYRLKYYLNS